MSRPSTNATPLFMRRYSNRKRNAVTATASRQHTTQTAAYSVRRPRHVMRTAMCATTRARQTRRCALPVACPRAHVESAANADVPSQAAPRRAPTAPRWVEAWRAGARRGEEVRGGGVVSVCFHCLSATRFRWSVGNGEWRPEKNVIREVSPSRNVAVASRSPTHVEPFEEKALPREPCRSYACHEEHDTPPDAPPRQACRRRSSPRYDSGDEYVADERTRVPE